MRALQLVGRLAARTRTRIYKAGTILVGMKQSGMKY